MHQIFEEEEQPLTVSELNEYIKEILENNFRNVFIVGEISGFKRSFPSGHSYFILKDEESQISCNLWNSRYYQLKFQPDDGKKVLIRGSLRLYKPKGTYSIDVLSIEEFGLGELQLKFEKLKKKLSDEGLFDERYKKRLPEFPERIAVITSETGAVIEDIKNVAKKRFPYVKMFLYPVQVQGKGASESICKAIAIANESDNNYDIILIARGGGSLEDLWTFNEENVARAVFKSRIPVVSAIGHEVDYTICDFVADLRAPTPSAAIEIILPDKSEVMKSLNNNEIILKRFLETKLTRLKSLLKTIEYSYLFNKPRDFLQELNIRLNEIEVDLHNLTKEKCNKLRENLFMDQRHLVNIFRAQRERITIHKKRLNEQNLRLKMLVSGRMKDFNNIISHTGKLLENINPETILKRGFTYITLNERIVAKKSSLKVKDSIKIHFSDGETGAEIIDNK